MKKTKKGPEDYKRVPAPECGERECFACTDGKCVILTDSDFGSRRCPFFKTKKQFRADVEKYRNMQ